MAKSSARTEKTVSKPGRKRMSRENRRKMILDAAIDFFADEGFDGSTHQLAARMGVTQPLIYSYFPNKEDLVKAVYEHVFIGQWRSEWDEILTDRTRPIRERLCDFYKSYTEVIHQPEWMRIYLQSGLRALDINRWYISMIEERIIERLCIELRLECGYSNPAELPISPEEMETLWTFHGGIFYYGVRRYVYQVPVSADFERVIKASITALLDGFPALFAELYPEKK